MLLTNNHFTPVLGIDIHFTTLPPWNPFHPFIGLVLDPFDYIPFIGGTVHVNGIKRGVSDSMGILVTLFHIPLFTPPWLMTPVIGHEAINFFASENVYADGSRLSPKGYMTMTCNDIGIPLTLVPGKKKFWKLIPTLFAPTSFMLPTPSGAPVMLGGPYVPDWGGMARMLLTGFGFGAIMRKAGKIFKPNKGLNNQAAHLMSSNKLTKPSKPTVKPSTPTVKPSTPTVKPSTPTVKPSKPHLKPSKPHLKPSKPDLKAGDKHPDWKGPVDYSDIKNPKTAGPNRPFNKSQKDQIYAKNKKANDGYIVSDQDGTILEAPKKSEKGVTPSQYEAQIDHKTAKSKGGENTGENAQVLSRKQNRDKSDS